MVRLPDPQALGGGPNFRAGGSAQVDPRLLGRGIDAIERGGAATAAAYRRGGEALDRAMETSAKAIASAAGGQSEVGRAVARGGAELSESIARGGARIGEAVGAGGARVAQSLERGGLAIAGAMGRAGDYWADATRSAGRSYEKGLHDFGAGLNKVAAAAIDIQLANDQLDFSERKTQWQVDRANLDQKYERDRDYGTMPQRYQDELASLREGLGEGIQNPAMKRRFYTETALGATESINRMKDRAFAVEKDVNVSQLRERLIGMQDAVAREPDDRARGEKLIDGHRYIDSAERKGYLTAEQAQKARIDWATSYSTAWVDSLPADARLQLLRERPAGREATIDRIIGIERGRTPDAKNERSSATGDGQFTNGTWMRMVANHRPDLMVGRTRDEVLALRTDPRLSREMVGHYYDANEKFLRANGVVPTPTNLYMAHFLGAQGAVDVLKAPRGTPLAAVVKGDAIAANPEVLGKGTTDTLIATLERKMGSVRGTGTPIDFIPEHVRAQKEKVAEKEIASARAAFSKNIEEQFDMRIQDYAAGRGPSFPLSEIRNNPNLSLEQINKLTRQYDSAIKTDGAAEFASIALAQGAPLNPYNKEHRAGVDALFERGVPVEQLVSTLKIVPEKAFTAIRGGADSADPKTVIQALEVANKWMADNVNIFTGRDGGTDIEKRATEYQYYVERLGKSREEAAAMVVKHFSPEHRNKVVEANSKQKLNEVMERHAKEADISNHFDKSWWPGGPKVAPSREIRDGVMHSFQELWKANYLAGDDPEIAKVNALKQLERSGRWGVTKVNGGDVVTHLPIENAPVYRDIDNVSERIAKEAVADAQKLTGDPTIDRSRIRLDSIPRKTLGDWEANRAPRYQLLYQDKNGHWQIPQREFVADPERMRAESRAARHQMQDFQYAAQRAADIERVNDAMTGTP